MQEVADWLNGLGMSEYAPRFAENDIDMEVLGELTDADFDRLGVSLGHRRKLLKALASIAEPPPSKSAVESAERRQVIVGSTSWSAGMDPGDLREASPVSSGLRPAEMISGRFLPRPRVPVSWPIAYDDRHDGAPQAGESGEAFVTDDDHDDPPRWRNCRHRDSRASFGRTGVRGRICLSGRVPWGCLADASVHDQSRKWA